MVPTAYPRAMAEETDPGPWSSLAVRILLGAAVLFVALSILGWVVGVVVGVLRALVVLAAIAAVGWIALVGVRR